MCYYHYSHHHHHYYYYSYLTVAILSLSIYLSSRLQSGIQDDNPVGTAMLD